jgi:hypothetical protein
VQGVEIGCFQFGWAMRVKVTVFVAMAAGSLALRREISKARLQVELCLDNIKVIDF